MLDNFKFLKWLALGLLLSTAAKAQIPYCSYSPAQTLTGTECILVQQNGHLHDTTTGAIAALGGGSSSGGSSSGGSGSNGNVAPLLTQTFDQAMTGANVVNDFLFGSSVSASKGQIAVKNCAQLALYFNWWGDSMVPPSWGDTPQGANGENFNNDMERFQACNGTNFSFGGSVLNLIAVNEQASSYQTTITTGTSGTGYNLPAAVPIATLGLVGTTSFSGTGGTGGTASTSLVIASVTQGGLYVGNQVSGTGVTAGTVVIAAPAGNTTGTYTLSQNATVSNGSTITSSNAPWVGEIVAAEFRGFYTITAISAGTSITLAPIVNSNATGIAFNNVVAFMPQSYDTIAATLNQGATGATLTTPVPAGCNTGMMFAVVNAGGTVVSNSTSRMIAINTGSGAVTFDNAWTYNTTFSAGTGMICMVPITSAQLWTSSYYSPGQAVSNWFGFDFYENFPTDSTGGYQLLNASCQPTVISSATVSAVPANYPWGEFPSDWMYGGNYPVTNSADNSEVDFITIRAYVDTGLWVDNPGFFNAGVPPAIAATQTPFTTAENCASGNNLFYTGTPNLIYTNTALAGAQRISAIYTPTQIYLYLNNNLLKVVNYQWSGQGWPQVGIQLPVGNFGATGRDLAFPLLSTNFPSYVFGLTRFRVLEMP